MSLYSIRPAAPEDAPEIARLTGQLGYPVSVDCLSPRLQRLLASSNDAVLVAEGVQGTLVGWIHGFLSQLLESDYRVEIGGLVVDDCVRRQGVGRELIRHLEDWALGQSVAQISVRCRQNRTEAHAFYESLGYRPAKTQIAFRKAIAKTAAR